MTERDLFWHYPHYGNQGGDPSSIIRNGQWKLIHYYEDGHDELYDLAADEGEQHDVCMQHPELVTAMRARLDDWLKAIDARLPEPDPEYDATKEAARLHEVEHVMMPNLEQQHAEYLDPDWQPNADWWNSQITID